MFFTYDFEAGQIEISNLFLKKTFRFYKIRDFMALKSLSPSRDVSKTKRRRQWVPTNLQFYVFILF
jgi:hypothetical protein